MKTRVLKIKVDPSMCSMSVNCLSIGHIMKQEGKAYLVNSLHIFFTVKTCVFWDLTGGTPVVLVFIDKTQIQINKNVYLTTITQLCYMGVCPQTLHTYLYVSSSNFQSSAVREHGSRHQALILYSQFLLTTESCCLALFGQI